jgi:hypothetical protein
LFWWGIHFVHCVTEFTVGFDFPTFMQLDAFQLTLGFDDLENDHLSHALHGSAVPSNRSVESKWAWVNEDHMMTGPGLMLHENELSQTEAWKDSLLANIPPTHFSLLEASFQEEKTRIVNLRLPNDIRLVTNTAFNEFKFIKIDHSEVYSIELSGVNTGDEFRLHSTIQDNFKILRRSYAKDQEEKHEVMTFSAPLVNWIDIR